MGFKALKEERTDRQNTEWRKARLHLTEEKKQKKGSEKDLESLKEFSEFTMRKHATFVLVFGDHIQVHSLCNCTPHKCDHQLSKTAFREV